MRAYMLNPLHSCILIAHSFTKYTLVFLNKGGL